MLQHVAEIYEFDKYTKILSDILIYIEIFQRKNQNKYHIHR